MAFSSSPVVDIGISMTLQDHFSGPSKDILSSWRGMLSDMNTFSSGVKQAYGNAIGQGVQFLKYAHQAYAYSAQVQKNTFLTNAILNDGSDHQAELLRDAQAINLRNPLTSMDITSGQKFMAMAGMGYEQIKAALEPAAQMAALFDMSMGGKGGTADLMTNVMAAFGIAAEDAAKTADILSVGTTSANVSMTDLAQSMKYVGASARLAGMDVSQVTAAIGVLGNYGIQGSMAGTNLGQALTQMNKAITGKSQDGYNTLKALGLDPKDLQDAKGNLLPLHDILVKIADVTDGLGGIQKQAIFFNLFGQRGMRAMMPLLDDITSGANTYLEIMQKLENSEGFNDKKIREYMQTMDGMLHMLNSAWDNFKTNVGDAIAQTWSPVIKEIIVPVLTTLSDLAKNPIGRRLFNFGAIMIGINILKNGFGYVSLVLKGITSGLLTGSTRAGTLAGGITKAAGAGTALERALMAVNAQLSEQIILMQQLVMIQTESFLMSNPGAKLRLPYVTASKVSGKNGLYTRYTPTGYTGPSAFNRGMGAALWLNAANTSQVNAVKGAKLTATLDSKGNILSSPMYMKYHKQWGKTLTRGVTNIGSTVSKGLGSVVSFMGGPYGLLIGAVLTFLPEIIDLLSSNNSKVDDEASLEAKRRAEEIATRKAIATGKTTELVISVNGKKQSYQLDGTPIQIDLEDDGYEYNGM